MGFQRAVPLPESAQVGEVAVSLRFAIQPQQRDALVRLELQSTAVGPVPLVLQDSAQSVALSMFVVP